MHNTGGRPRIDMEKALRYLCEALRLDATVEEACSYARISERTFYRYNKNEEGFWQEISTAQCYPFLVAKGAVIGAIEGGDVKTALRFLELREPKRYSNLFNNTAS